MSSVELLTTRAEFGELAASRGRLRMLTSGTDDEAADEWWRSTRRNPAGEGALVVVRDDGAIVACGNYTPKLFVHEGERLVVAEFGGMYTAPEARSRGLFQVVVNELESVARRRGVTAGYATANQRSGPIFVAKLGWREVEDWIRWIRPAVPGVRIGLDWAARARAGRPRGEVVVEVTEPAIADDSIDDARQNSNHFERSPQQFEWRYPRDRYVMARAFLDGELQGWCVAGRTTRVGRPTAAIADWALAADARPVAVPLLSAITRTFSGVQFVFGGSLAGGHAALWRSLFAFGRPAKMPLIAKGLNDSADAEIFRGMSFDIGDSDTV